MISSKKKKSTSNFKVICKEVDPSLIPDSKANMVTLPDGSQVDMNEQIRLVEEAIDSLDVVLVDLTTNEEYPIFKIVEQFRSENYNKLTIDERTNLFATLNAYFAGALTSSFLTPEVYTADDNVNGKWIDVEEGKVFINKSIFKNKNFGLDLIRGYLMELRIDMIYSIVGGLYQINANRNDVKGLAKTYYDNICQSNLYNNWNNFLSKEHPDYAYQPIIIDSSRLTNEVSFMIVKKLYKKYQVIDEEISSLIYSIMEFRGRMDFFKKQRKKVIKLHQQNIAKINKEFDSYMKYLQVTLSDLSKLSDDEFYALFNSSYYYGLNINDDGFMIERLTSLANELIVRVFNDFDLENVELPIFEFHVDDDFVVTMKVIYDNEIKECRVTDSYLIFQNVMQAMSAVAQRNKLFRFKDEQEEKDYDDMREWYNYKKVHESKDPMFQEIIHDGLNIVSRKVTEMWRNLQFRIEDAISKCDEFNKGRSMIIYDNKESYYDYHEFKNGYTQEEVTANMMELIREDLKLIKSKGGR